MEKAKILGMGAIILSALTTSYVANAADTVDAKSSAPKIEKCYGIAKAGKNDCAAKNHGCAGHAVKAGDTAEWLNLPAGLCERINGGSTTAGK